MPTFINKHSQTAITIDRGYVRDRRVRHLQGCSPMKPKAAVRYRTTAHFFYPTFASIRCAYLNHKAVYKSILLVTCLGASAKLLNTRKPKTFISLGFRKGVNHTDRVEVFDNVSFLSTASQHPTLKTLVDLRVKGLKQHSKSVASQVGTMNNGVTDPNSVFCEVGQGQCTMKESINGKENFFATPGDAKPLSSNRFGQAVEPVQDVEVIKNKEAVDYSCPLEAVSEQDEFLLEYSLRFSNWVQAQHAGPEKQGELDTVNHAGEQVRALRAKRKLSREVVGERTGLSSRFLFFVESGLVSPDEILEVLDQLESALETDLSDLKGVLGNYAASNRVTSAQESHGLQPLHETQQARERQV